MATTAQLDKSLGTALTEGHGSIVIRVVVLEKGMASAAATAAIDAPPADAEPDEVLPETDKRPISGFLEEPKRGHQCCVFLINGQRQHAWNNQFIVRDLELKYLRNRMIVVVDCDGLNPEAIAELMSGHNGEFREGRVYARLRECVLSALADDLDLRRIEDEMESVVARLPHAPPEVYAMFESLLRSI